MEAANPGPSSDKPPVFQSWSHWYWLLLGALFIQVVLFYWLTAFFS